MLIDVTPAGQYGVVKDPMPRELPINAWTNARNVVFRDGAAVKSKGEIEVYSPTAVKPYYLIPFVTPVHQFWLYCGLSAIYVHDGSSATDLSKVGGYNATVGEKWTGGVLSGVVVVSNPNDNPQYWGGDTGVKFADLTNWPPSGVTTMRCRVLRPHLNQLIVGDVTKDSTRYPQLVKWSSVADPGTLPDSWDETDPTKLTGEKDLADTPGHVVDMMSMGQVNVVYKEDAVVAMTYVGRTFVYNFEYLSRAFGIFAPHCVTQVYSPIRQIALGYDDVVQVEGRSIKSILRGKLRQWLFNTVDNDNLKASFVVANDETQEVWVCFPESGESECTLALVYNVREDKWGVRELSSVVHAARGVLDTGASPSFIDGMTTTVIDEMMTIIDEREYNPTIRRLVQASAANSKLLMAEYGEQMNGADMSCSLERTEIGYVLDRYGNLLRDATSWKLLKRIMPRFTGTGTVQVYVGGQSEAGGSITWHGPWSFEIGVDESIPVWIPSYRLHSIRFESSGNQAWKLEGYLLELELTGRIW